MNKISFQTLLIIAIFSLKPGFAQISATTSTSKQVTLPNGWKLSPAGRSLPLGDLPLNMALSKNGEYLAVTNNGESTQSLQLIDPKNEVLLDSLELAESWYGLTFSKNSKHLYVSGGNKNYILDFRIKKGKIVPQDTISLGKPWPKNKISPTGIAVTKNSRFLYAVTKEDNSVYKVELPSGKILDTTKLPVMAYSCKLSPKEGKLYVSLWGKDEVAVYNTQTTKVEKMITVGSHPNEMLLNKKGTLLFVANANDNSVSVINTASNKVLETLSTSLYPTDLTGSTTNGIALSEDENTLYIANADNNNLAVFDVSNPGNSKSKGFIPVGWYPTNVKVSKDKILVTNGKGFSSQANPYGPQPVSKEDNSSYQKGDTTAELQYIGSLFKGTLSFIEAPDAETLKTYTKQVYANTPFHGNDSIQKYFEKNPIPSKPGGPTPIKYVFYIIKENRTYDQIMGDVKKGNGEDSLCIFGRRITPNHHA
ncbi:MAG: YncE family protein, partial [Gillisia sp.]